MDEDTVFATKPELAARMIGRFLDAGHRVGWVAGDEVYGGNLKLRSALEARGTGYVLPSSARLKSLPVRGSSAWTPWPRRHPNGPGRRCRQGLAPRGTASTTGPSSTWPNPDPAVTSC
ncbi:transposase [Streptomyces parvulus]|uniref:transposase n=1 Tax=Streptomyces parvulus TaxID=146923 RepID=UPI003EBD1353